MARYVGHMEHRTTGLRVPLYQGWSWPAFFFGPFWFMAKGMWLKGILFLVFAIFSAGIVWLLGMIIAPLIANGQYAESLAGRDYRMGHATDESRGDPARVGVA